MDTIVETLRSDISEKVTHMLPSRLTGLGVLVLSEFVNTRHTCVGQIFGPQNTILDSTKISKSDGVVQKATGFNGISFYLCSPYD